MLRMIHSEWGNGRGVSWSEDQLTRRRVDTMGAASRTVAAGYGALLATTPMLATVSPFFIEGTAQTYRITPLDGARASHIVLPNRSVTQPIFMPCCTYEPRLTRG